MSAEHYELMLHHVGRSIAYADGSLSHCNMMTTPGEDAIVRTAVADAAAAQAHSAAAVALGALVALEREESE